MLPHPLWCPQSYFAAGNRRRQSQIATRIPKHMRTLVHISDLHFGRLDPRTVPALRDAILASRPDILVVSGDLTQRARNAQFASARRFLDSLPVPRVVVPGNHDVPLYNLMARWLWPLAAYRRHIEDDIEPFYADGE